jgi:hypothetical protein
MKITKNRGMFFISVFIALVMYNVIVFVIPILRGGWFWTGYGFTVLAILLAAAVIYYTFDKEDLRSKFYRVPLTFLALCYLGIQLVLGFMEMILQVVVMKGVAISFQYGIAVNIVLLGVFLIGLISVEMGKDEIERIDGKVKEKVFYIKSLQIDIENLVNKAPDDSLKKMLKDLAEAIRYSDPMSSPQLAVIENKIEAKAAALSDIVEKTDWDTAKVLCNELHESIAERNRKCKALK